MALDVITDFYVIAVCHTNRSHEHITLWRPENKGYTPVIARAGKYARDLILTHLDYYNTGDHIAVPTEFLDALAVPVRAGYYDHAGPAVPNTKQSWKQIKDAIVFPTPWPVKPDWHGKPGRRAA
jgi:hypothetical protein